MVGTVFEGDKTECDGIPTHCKRELTDTYALSVASFPTVFLYLGIWQVSHRETARLLYRPISSPRDYVDLTLSSALRGP